MKELKKETKTESNARIQLLVLRDETKFRKGENAARRKSMRFIPPDYDKMDCIILLNYIENELDRIGKLLRQPSALRRSLRDFREQIDSKREAANARRILRRLHMERMNGHELADLLKYIEYVLERLGDGILNPSPPPWPPAE